MKFISKSSNLHVILKPGIPEQPITGTPASPTVSVRFQDGIAVVKDENMVELMRSHQGYNVDFIEAEEESPDPYAGYREESEPAHVLQEMKYGHPGGRNVSPVKKPVPESLKKLIHDQSVALAKEMLPTMVEETLKKMAESSKEKQEQNSSVSNSSNQTEEKNIEETVSQESKADTETKDEKKKSPGRPGRPKKK